MADKKKKVDSDRVNNYDDDGEDSDRGSKKEKRDKNKESPREQKSKKYSDTRKERFKNDVVKTDKQAAISKLMSSDKSKSLNHDDIKPFTQLPQVKTDDLTKMIDSMDKKMKLEESKKDSSDEIEKVVPKIRRSSMESADGPFKEESKLKRQKSLNCDDRCRSTDREGSEEKEKGDVDRRTERRIRNKVIMRHILYNVIQ